MSLRCKRLSRKTETAKVNDLGEEKSLVVTQFKGKCQNFRLYQVDEKEAD
jgi:hypothetical protein